MPLAPQSLTFGRLQVIRSLSNWQVTALRYALPFVSVSAAVAIARAFDLFQPETPYPVIFLIFAVVISAWFGGPIPGWISVALATLAVDYFLTEPLFAVTLDRRTLSWSVAFFICAVISNIFSLYRRRTETALRRARDELDVRVKERTAELNAALEMLKSEVDERVRAEAAQRRAEQDVARFNRIMTMGALTASIAHEINQPLTAITANGNAALFWLKRDPPCLDETRESIVAMIAAAKRASSVVGEIRGLIEKGTTGSEEVDLNEVITGILSLVRRDINLRGIDLKLQLDKALPKVHGGRVALQQVILNMIMNGIEALEPVSDRSRELIIKSQTVDANGIAVTVEDSGVGLTESDTNKLFSPFFTTKPNGIGMGLAICRSIAEALGGHMTASGRLPHGAAFSIVLPRSREQP